MTSDRSFQDLAERILRAVSPELCHFVDLDRIGQDFLAELYLRILQELRSATSVEDVGPGFADPLALAVYLATTTQSRTGSVNPDLIPRLERIIAPALSPAPDGPRTHGDTQKGSG